MNNFGFPFSTAIGPSSHGSAVGVATGYRLDGRGAEIRVPEGSRMISFPSRPDRFWGQPRVAGDLSPGIERQKREDIHSSPTNGEVKKTWVYTFTPPIRLHVVLLNYFSTRTTLPLII
jgi:hypothetical protein